MRVSVIAAVYNAELFLEEFVESFLAQTLSPASAELIAVDDGSTDRSGDMLDRLASEHDNIRVIHQENSGWPGRPRNVGTDLATGEYVFYADPDDKFGGRRALEKLADFADEYRSDVVVPRMIGSGGRHYGQWRYETTQIDADLVTCFATLTPQKLFRRSMLVNYGIRFPEEKVRLEDGQFLSRAYLQAQRVSILTGYAFYLLVKHEGQNHLTAAVKQAASYIGSVTAMSHNVEKYCHEEDLGDRIINQIYFRKVLGNFASSRLLRHSTARRREWLASQQEYIERFINQRRYEKLSDAGKARTDLVLRGDMDAITSFARTGKVEFELVSVSSNRGNITIRGSLYNYHEGAPFPELVLIERGGSNNELTVKFRRERAEAVAVVPRNFLPVPNLETRYNLWIKPGEGHLAKRIAGPKAPYSVRFTDHRTIEVYTTKSGNLSLKVSQGLNIKERGVRAARRALGRWRN